MAKTRKNSVNSDFDLDGDLDFGKFDFPDPTIRDDRKPIIKATTGFAKGLKSGVRDSAFLKRTLKDVLPKGYGESMDTADKITQSMRSLYDESAKEIKPAIRETKRVIAKLTPRESKLVPKSVLAAIKRWEEEDKRSATSSRDSMRESMMSAQLTDIFRSNAQTEAMRYAQAEGKDRLKEGVELHRHREISDFMFRSAVSLDKLQKYQSSVTLGFQKKSLELQYRQLFATQDTLQFLREDAVRREATLLAISKNTSLPDAVKINSKEAKAELARARLNESIHKGIFGGRDAYIEKTLKHINDMAMGKIRDIAGGMQMGLGAAEMAGDMGGMAGDPYSMGGQMGGEMTAQSIGSMMGGKLNKALSGGKFGKVGNKILAGGKSLEYFNETLGQKINTFRKSRDYDFDDSLKGRGMRFAQGLLPGMGPDLSTQNLTAKDMGNPANWTNRSDKSINEVIPGFLSRILREMQMVRTGSNKVELMQFDFNKSKFTSKGKNEAAAFKDIISASSATRTQGQLDKLIDQIDPTRKLSSEARAELKKKLLTNSAEFGEANKANLGMYASYKDVKENIADEIVPLMRGFLTNLNGDSRTEFARANNALAGSIADPRAAIQQQINLGNIQYLKKMGLVDKSGTQIDMKKVIEYMLDPRLVNRIQQGAKATDPNMAAGNAFKNMAKSLTPKSAPMDVFVKGEITPRLLAVKMHAGAYKDMLTGEVIKHHTQIKGVVQDMSNNNAVVIEASDLTRLAYVNVKTNTLEAFDVVKKTVTDLYSQTAGGNGLVGKTLALGMSKARAVLGEADERVADVFVQGEAEPRMLAIKMAAGQYFDKLTGKVIRHQNQIDGAVEDENKRTVIAAEDIPNLNVWYVERQKFGKIRFLGRIAKSIAMGIWNFQTKIALPWTKWNFKMLGMAGKGALTVTKRLLGIGKGPVRDVYVQGETEPRLYAARLKAGDYRDRNSGERIMHQNDITGPVIDRDDQVVLSEDDMPKLQVYNSILRMLNPLPTIGKVIKGIGKGLWAAQKFGVKTSIYLLKNLAAAAGKLVGAGVRFISKPQDVLVRGQTSVKLSGIVMRQGGYISVLTQKVIGLPSDIDGAVMGTDGQIVITDDEFKRGLTDTAGNPIRTNAIGAIKKGLSTVNKLFSRRVSLNMKQRGKITTSLLKDKAISAGDKTVLLLQDIRTLFDKQFNGKKSIFGDSDGDGDRDGSWQDKLKNRAGKAAGSIPGMGGLFGKPKGKAAGKKEEDEEGMGLLDMLGMAADGKELLGGRRGRGGRFGRMAGLGKYGKLAAGGALAGAAAYGIDGLAGKMGAGKNDINATADSANWDKMNTWEKMQSGLGRGIEHTGEFLFMDNLANSAKADRIKSETAYMNAKDNSPGSKLMDYLKMPIHLGAGLAMFDLAKGLFGASLSPYDKIRYVQYGFSANNTDNVSKMKSTESYLTTLVKQGQEALELDEAKLDVKKLMGPWGMSHTDEKQMAMFFEWYQNRFKPVFLTHLTAIKNATGTADLSATSKLKGDEIKKYIDVIRFSDGPYEFATLPTTNLKIIATTASDVKNAVEQALRDLGVEKGKANAKKAAVGAVVAGAVKVDAAGKPVVGGGASRVLGTGESKLPNMNVASVSTVSTSTMPTTGKISALDAIRFKAYGLVEMDSDKVVSLHLLEKAVRKETSFDGNNVASWKGNPMGVLENIAGSFGIGDVYGKEANDWAAWFKNRFMPVYMGYLSGYKVLTGKDDASSGAFALKPDQQLTLAKIITGLRGIWSVMETPWPGYKVSTDSEGSKANLQLLEDTAKQTKLQEEKKVSSPKSETSASKAMLKTAYKPSQQAGYSGSNSMSAYQPDAEVQVKGGGGSSVGISSSNAGSIPMAGGAVVDGRNAMAHLNIKKGVSLDRMNPAVLKNFYGMAEEYGMLTGKKVGVNDGFRTYADQVAAKKKHGSRAAEPGTSLHEYGLALDIDTANLDEMEKMGLMRKYGFTRPVGGESWHMEPIGIQHDITGYKNNLNKAIDAVNAGLGKGGGGMGTVANAPLYTRNADLSKKIMTAAIRPNVENKPKGSEGAPGTLAQPGEASAPGNNPSAYKAATAPSGGGSVVRTSFGARNDGEAKPSSGGYGSGITPMPSFDRGNSAADPSVKVPDPTGSGYQGLKATIEAAAKLVGVDPDILIKTAAVESGFDPSARSKSSSASGLFQFTSDTWRAMMDKYGRKYGMTAQNTSPNDPKAASIMAAHYIKETTQTLGRRTNRPIGATEAYMGHFMGAGGASKFLGALQDNPNAIGSQLMPDAASANKDIFFGGGRPLTVSEIYAAIDSKVRNKAKSFGINTNDSAPIMAQASKPGSSSMPSLPNQPGITQVGYQPSKAAPSQVSNQAGPLSDAYGFRPQQASVAIAPTGQSGQINKEIMRETETILGKSLDVQTQSLEVLKSIHGIVSAGAPGSVPGVPAPSTNPSKPYVVPKATVPMKRATT